MGGGAFGGIYFGAYSLIGSPPIVVIVPGEPVACIVVPFDDRTIGVSHESTILVRFDDRNILTPESERCE